MAKIVRHLRSGQMDFQKVFAKLCNTKSAWQVWSDFVEMVAIAISNSCELRSDVREKREADYLNIINTYSKDHQSLFPEMLSILTFSLEENPEQDFLGEMFMALELGSHWHGQFFTPYSLCTMMAQISIDDAKDKIAERGYVSVCDCACGAGATLIGARNALSKAGIGGSQAFFVGQDISRTAGLMCYIQLSLLGCAGYVVIADSLLHPITGPLLFPNITPEQEAWFMPMNFFDPIWAFRRYCEITLQAETEDTSCHEIATAPQTDVKEEPEAHEPQEVTPEPVEVVMVTKASGQLALF